MIDWNDCVALWQIVSERTRISAANGPLRAIAIVQWFRDMGCNFAGPAHAAHSRECLAQNLELELYLRIVRRVLVVATAAGPEMWTHGLYARGIRVQNFQRLSPHQLFLARSYSSSNFFRRQNVWNKHSISVGMSEPIAAIHHLLNQ